MKGITFYLEYDTTNDKRKNKHNGNCLAVFKDNKWLSDNGWRVEAVSSVYYHPNSDVASTSVSYEYLAKRCKRISETKAREIHPRLFTYLEEVN